VVKILQGSVVTQTVLGHYISFGCKSICANCQTLWKLAAGSRQSFCKNRQAYFSGSPCSSRKHICRAHSKSAAAAPASKQSLTCNF